jgi:hypothetical protein
MLEQSSAQNRTKVRRPWHANFGFVRPPFARSFDALLAARTARFVKEYLRVRLTSLRDIIFIFTILFRILSRVISLLQR